MRDCLENGSSRLWMELLGYLWLALLDYLWWLLLWLLLLRWLLLLLLLLLLLQWGLLGSRRHGCPICTRIVYWAWWRVGSLDRGRNTLLGICYGMGILLLGLLLWWALLHLTCGLERLWLLLVMVLRVSLNIIDCVCLQASSVHHTPLLLLLRLLGWIMGLRDCALLCGLLQGNLPLLLANSSQLILLCLRLLLLQEHLLLLLLLHLYHLLLLEEFLFSQHLLLLAKLVDNLPKVIVLLGMLGYPVLYITLLIGRYTRLLLILLEKNNLGPRVVHLLANLGEFGLYL